MGNNNLHLLIGESCYSCYGTILFGVASIICLKYPCNISFSFECGTLSSSINQFVSITSIEYHSEIFTMIGNTDVGTHIKEDHTVS